MKRMLIIFLPILVILTADSYMHNTTNPNTALMTAFTASLVSDRPKFTNPLFVDGDKADPWIISNEGYYYYIYSSGHNSIYIKKSKSLQDIYDAREVRVWKSPPGKGYSSHLWAPELHFLRDKWYIYFAADDGRNEKHRMYVLQGNSSDPQGAYTFKGKINAPEDKWAIDGTVLEHDGYMYFIWSGWEGNENVQQNLYIAPMSNPWTISGERVCISSPDYGWEKSGGPPFVNEAPQVLKRKDKIYIIYSASGYWTDDYCLGQLSYTGGNILSKTAWVKKNEPVFSKTPWVRAPGHCCFVKSPDGTEDWIVYHARYPGSGSRNIRIQRFSWDNYDMPEFGKPVECGIPIDVPAGVF